jgi:hypothetical protein
VDASIPVGGKCACLAAQVKHVTFHLDLVEKSVRGTNFPKADWGETWRTVERVTPEEWQTIQGELRSNSERILILIKSAFAWPGAGEIADAIAVVAHPAYHLGEILQALCTLRA